MRSGWVAGLVIALGGLGVVGCEAASVLESAGVGKVQTRCNAPAPKQIEVEEPLPEAALYAEGFGVSVEEATRRLELQERIPALLQRLKRKIGDQFDVAWIEHEPDYQVVVRVTAGATAQDVCDVVISWPVAVIAQSGARYTEAELRAAMNRIDQLLHERYPEMSMGTDTPADAIWIMGPDRPSDSFLARLTDLAGVPIRYEEGGPAGLD
jgi:streptogrisin C